MTLFDVRKSRYWKPLFDKSHPAPIGLVHNLNFLHRKSNHIKDLTKIIELKIMKKMSAWRLHRKTVWNRFVSDSLKKVLANMETDVCFEYEMDRYMEHLNQLSNSYKVRMQSTKVKFDFNNFFLFKAYGFPLQTKYTVLSQIVALVKNTGIHLNSDARAEFALAVYIKEYTNNILSVWIFLISLTPKN
jgi:coiled-coil and C2 domain-containing protein 2A